MATHARTVVPVTHNPWAALATQCQRDAAAIVNSAILRASGSDCPRLSGVTQAMIMLYGQLMADNAKLGAEVASLRKRVGNGNFVQRWLRRGNT
jgi:hypothetical protein